MSAKISIIIPVYNGETYLEETLKSVLAQTYFNFELICVDDSSTDNSFSILQSFSDIDSRVKVFSKPNGGTAAKAIIYALRFATGDYFMYASQDDLFSPDLFEKNIDVAKSFNANAVIPDMILYWGDVNSREGRFGLNGNRSLILSGREALILSLDWTIHGFVLWDMKTVREIGFHDFGLNSDEFTTRILYLNSERVAFSTGTFYYRQNNSNAITKKWNIRQLDCFDTSNRLQKLLIENNFDTGATDKIQKNVFTDLIRIQLMFLENQKKLSSLEKDFAKKGIKEVYLSNLSDLRALRFTSMKQNLVNRFILAGYNYFIVYIYIHQFYHKFLNENQ